MADELSRFVREALEREIPRPRIAAALREAGWPADQIDNALDEYAEVDFPIPVPRARPYLSAREAFLYLVLFSALYTAAVSFISLAFRVIGFLLPEPDGMATGISFLASIRWSVAALVVSYPIFLALSVSTQRAIDRDPGKRTSKIRKWLTYLTLFVAAATLVVDLITLISYFLDGDVSIRFLLKVLVVGGVAAVVFRHYLGELKQADETADGAAPQRRLVAWSTTGAVAALLITALSLAASPWMALKVRFDRQRTRDLQQIAHYIERRWDEGGEVPDDLATFAALRGVNVSSIHDPLTGEPYGFRRLGEETFELCAVFETEQPSPGRRRTGTPSFWAHGTGRNCFLIEKP